MEGGDIKHKMLLLIKYEVVMKKNKDFGGFLSYHPNVNIKLPQELLGEEIHTKNFRSY